MSSAYTAACTDFLRRGCIDKIDTSKYDKGQIAIKAFKADLGIEEVTVQLSTPEQGVVLKGRAVSKGQGWWLFQHTAPFPTLEGVIITVKARDKTGNVTRAVQAYGKNVIHFHDWPAPAKASTAF